MCCSAALRRPAQWRCAEALSQQAVAAAKAAPSTTAATTLRSSRKTRRRSIRRLVRLRVACARRWSVVSHSHCTTAASTC